MVKRFITAITILLLLIINNDQTIAQSPVFVKYYSRSTPINIPIIKLKDYHNLPKDTIYSEVLSYSKNRPFGDHHGRVTNVHETVHSINNYLNNAFALKKVRGFYAGNGMGILLQQPQLKLENVIVYIPESLRGYRYKTYFVNSLKYWNEIPFYPIDEWSAYISGAECALDDYSNNIKATEKLDSVSGTLEFSIYCVALSMCVKQNQENYWYTYPEFKNAIHLFLIKSEKLFFDGRYIFPSLDQEKLLHNLLNNDECLYIRNFLITEFDGIFIQ
jgi:hypothetical protein